MWKSLTVVRRRQGRKRHPPVRADRPTVRECIKLTGMRKRLTWVTIYAVAMAYLESAVVVYLRAIYYPHGFEFPIALMPADMAAIEVGREAATIVMLLGVAMVAGSDRWERFLAFCLSFGVWDIFYYVWLWIFIQWPSSLFTWDVLFLIPVPWIGPVLAPVLVSVALVAGSLLMLRLKAQGVRLGFSAPLWALAVTGGLVVVGSFVLDFSSAVSAEGAPAISLGRVCQWTGPRRGRRGARCVAPRARSRICSGLNASIGPRASAASGVWPQASGLGPQPSRSDPVPRVTRRVWLPRR